MKKIIFRYPFILVTLLLGIFPLHAEKKPKPNIVFFLVDDLGWSDVACFGSSFYETPAYRPLGEGGGEVYFRVCRLSCLFPDSGEYSHWEISCHHEPDRVAQWAFGSTLSGIIESG